MPGSLGLLVRAQAPSDGRRAALGPDSKAKPALQTVSPCEHPCRCVIPENRHALTLVVIDTEIQLQFASKSFC